jgi:predicted dehydrogenase
MASGSKSGNIPEINIGVIGYGFMGKAHSIGYRKMPYIFWPPPAVPRLLKICGRNKDRVAEEAKRYGYSEYCTDWREVVEDERVDIVVNLTPHYMHKTISIEAAKNGKHIICEKPLALDQNESEKMLEEANKARVKHLCNYNYRMIPALTLVKNMILEGKLGKIYHFRATYLQEWLVDPGFPLTWAVQKDKSGSGALCGIGSHIIDLARWLCGEPRYVSGITRTFTGQRPLPDDPGKKGNVDVDDAFAGTIEFDNGAIGTIEASRFCPGRKNAQRIEINGELGSLYFELEHLNFLNIYFRDDDRDNTAGFRSINVTEQEHPYYRKWWPHGHTIGWGDTFVHTAYNMLDAVVNNHPLEPMTATFEDGYRNTVICDAILNSAQTGRKQKISYKNI